MPMNCPYCRTVNDAADHRCARCGRRLHAASGRPGPELVVSNPHPGNSGVANVATAFALAPELEIPNPPPAASPGEVQPSLFRDELRQADGPRIVAIPTLAPSRPASTLDREGVRRNAMRSAARRAQAHSQQELDLQEEQQPKPGESLYCDARVAPPSQRALAAAADGVVVVLGTAIFLGFAAWAGVDFTVGRNLLVLPVAMAAVVAALYRGIWCLADSDTPGMRFAGLQLVDFDGRKPKRENRIVRQFAGLLSLLAAGVGLVWALADEESLTWHDHISKTFPTAG